jgi:O-antigen ligase
VTDSIAPAPGAGRLRSPDVLAASAALALMASLPFLNPVHLFPLPTFFEESLALGLGLIALACIAFSRQPGPTAIPVISIWTLALALVFLLQPLWSGTPYAEPATIAGLYVLWAAAVMWVGAQMRLADVERISLLLATALLLGAMVGAAVAWIQMLGLASQVGTWIPALQNGRAPGVLAQVNLHANYLVVGSASLVFLWTERRISSAAALLCGVLLAGGIAFAASRAALLELAWLLFASFWLRRRGPREPGARAFWVGVLAFALILAVCAAATAMGFESRGVSDRVTRIGESSQYVVRLSIYEAAIRTWLSAPLGGVGVGGFAWAHYTTATPWVGDVPMNPEKYAHDIVLQLLAEAGVIGAGIFIAGVVLWFTANARPSLAVSGTWRMWSMGIVGIELVHSLFEFPLWHAHFLGLAALLTGLSDRRVHRMASSVSSRALALVAAAIGGALLCSTVLNHRDLIYWSARQSGTAAEQQALEQSLRRLRRSFLAPYIDVGIAGSLIVSRESLLPKIAFLDRVLHFWPVAPLVQKQIAFLAMAGKDEEALALLGNLARLQPQYVPDLNAQLEAISGDDIPAGSPVRRRARELAETQMTKRAF